MREWRSTARVPGRSLVFSPGMSTPPLAFLAGVAAEGPGRGELAELVTHHRFGDVDGHVLAAVVHGDRVPDHVGDDRGAARPGLHDALLVSRVQVVDLFQEMVVDERSLF